MKTANFFEYNGHKFTGVTIMDNGEFRVGARAIRTRLYGCDATVILDPKTCKPDAKGHVHIADVNGKYVSISKNKALYEVFGIEYRKSKQPKKAHKPRPNRKSMNSRTYLAQFENGEMVGRFKNMKDCERCTGISRDDVRKMLDGEVESVSGYTFEIRERQKAKEPGMMW